MSDGWTVVHEKKVKGSKGADVWPDGTVIDRFHLTRGYWEAKDTKDDLRVEAKKKFDKGYPKDNILFQEPGNVALYQDGALKFEGPIGLQNVDNLLHALKQFFEYRKPEHLEWEKAVEQFKEEVPKLSESLQKVIAKERISNKKFITAFEGFCDLCRQAINPNLSELAVERMLIQHMLTERIFRKVF